MKRLSFVIIFSLIHSFAYANSIMDVYQLALENDPTLSAAQASLAATLENKNQTLAAFYPTISYSQSISNNTQDISASSFGQGGKSHFNNHRHSLDLTQPIFHYELFAGLEQVNASNAKAQAEYASILQSLIIRTAQAYFDHLAANDNLTFARAEKNAIERQLEQAKQRYEVGIVAITDVHEAQARYDQAVAQEIVADNAVYSSEEGLIEITNQKHKQLNSLSKEFPLTTPEPNNITDWEQVSLQQNLQLTSAQYSIEVAQEEITIQRTGHYPSVDLVASRTNSISGGGQFGSTETDTDSISMQLSVPLFQGGSISSKVRQAKQLFEQAIADKETIKRSILRDVRDAFRGVIAGISEVKALAQVSISSQSAYDATYAGFEVGTRTIVDVLNAEGEQHRAKRDLAKAKYNYLLNTLLLKQAAGTLSEQDITHIDRYLN